MLSEMHHFQFDKLSVLFIDYQMQIAVRAIVELLLKFKDLKHQDSSYS